MGFSISIFDQKGVVLFLNLSFLLVGFAFICIQLNSSDVLLLGRIRTVSVNDQDSCKSFQNLDDYDSKCHRLQSNNPCVSQGYIDYLYLFYCNFESFPYLGYLLLFLWLLVLFYVLGNTASEYFCSSLESLSSLLKLSPTIAGVTLLSLGNGAPDVFSSLVAFMGKGTNEIGLDSVLGGASFITCVVVGIISVMVRRREIRVEKFAFIRDICFFIVVLLSVLVILILGEIRLWGAIAFASMYIVYVVVVSVSRSKSTRDEEEEDPEKGSDLRAPMLSGKEKEEEEEEGCMEGAIFPITPSPSCITFLRILDLPLYLPRRLTIPVISDEKWSKFFAVSSVFLAPILLSALWASENQNYTSKQDLVTYGVGFTVGLFLATLAFFTTESSNPPRKCLFPWLLGGFLMSITWTYITAQELVGLLVSIGYIIGVSPSILAFTVLAWGNSLGDLIANSAMAINGGQEGAQIAISGCYAGPIFNVLFGLGLSLVGATWSSYPSPVEIPNSAQLWRTMGVLIAGLLWALLVLPCRKMKLDGVLGGGLLLLYLISLSLMLVQTLVSN